MVGTNENDYGEWADKFTSTGGGDVDRVHFLPSVAYAATPSGYFTFNIYESTVNGPGTVLYTQDILITGLVINQWNSVTLNTPVTVPNEFFAGFKAYLNTPVDTFGLLCNSANTTNTLWFHWVAGGFDLGWKDNGAFTGGQMTTAMGIGLNMCTPTNIDKNIETDNSVIVYPNPSKDILNINSVELVSRVEIYNLLGKIVKVSELSSTDFSINVSDLAAGSYVINLYTKDGVKPQRFLKTL